MVETKFVVIFTTSQTIKRPSIISGHPLLSGSSKSQGAFSNLLELGPLVSGHLYLMTSVRGHL